MFKAKDMGCELILVDAESLSMEDEIMKYEPKTGRERSVKELIHKAISAGVKNFYRPKIDPSFTDDEKGFCFAAGKDPALGKSYNWWIAAIRNYSNDYSVKLGTRLQYGAFLGVYLKRLVEAGNSLEWSWNAVCNDSVELGHYWNSLRAKHTFEPTGSREFCGFCDLANVYKILADDNGSNIFWMAGGFYGSDSKLYPIADICRGNTQSFGLSAVGWVVVVA